LYHRAHAISASTRSCDGFSARSFARAQGPPTRRLGRRRKTSAIPEVLGSDADDRPRFFFEEPFPPGTGGPFVCCHTFRATGITAYLENGGSLENAQAMAAHESPRTTKLYDRTGDEITLDEVERIVI
jgi:integrase